MLQYRTHLGQIDLLQVLHKDNQVGISYGYSYPFRERIILAQTYRMDVSGFAHIYRDGSDPVFPVGMQVQGLDA